MKTAVRQVSLGVAALFALVTAAGGSLLGCTPEEEESPSEIGITGHTISAGSASLELVADGTYHLRVASSTTDEFVRTGESLNFTLPSWVLWGIVDGSGTMPSHEVLKKRLRATVDVSFYDRGAPIGSQKVSMKKWAAPASCLFGETESLIVPEKTDQLRFTLTVHDAERPDESATIPSESIVPVQVFGGELPRKTVIFDDDFGLLRQRIIEGKNLVHGAEVSIFYTDWRADVLVDRSSLDTQIGTVTSYGRFGTTEVLIYGKLAHEISYAVSYDDGLSFSPDKPLIPNAQSALGPGRTGFEAIEAIPAAATGMQVYFHVKTYLVADYSAYPHVTQKWYTNGERVLKRDKYDNSNGPFTNYDLSLQ